LRSWPSRSRCSRGICVCRTAGGTRSSAARRNSQGPSSRATPSCVPTVTNSSTTSRALRTSRATRDASCRSNPRQKCQRLRWRADGGRTQCIRQSQAGSASVDVRSSRGPSLQPEDDGPRRIREAPTHEAGTNGRA
jgi:hypothetical protein